MSGKLPLAMLKIMKTRLNYGLVAVLLAFIVAATASGQTATPVVFPLVSMFGGIPWRGTVTLTAAQSRWTDGTNIYGGTFLRTNLPSGATNLTILCSPNGYTVNQDGIRQPYTFYLPPGLGTNPVNVLTLSTNIPTLTNYFAGAGTATKVNNSLGTNVNLQGIFNGVAAGQGVTNGASPTFNTVTLTNQGISLTVPSPFNVVSAGASVFNIWTNQDVFYGVDAGAVDAPAAAPLVFDLNTGIGAYAVQFNSTGLGNTGLGAGALQSSHTGWNNTAVGSQALMLLGAYNVAGGTNNIALGFNAGSAFQNNESGNIDIGNIGVAAENNIIRIGAGQTDTYLTGTLHGNAGGLTNFTGLVVTNSPTGYLTSGAFRTMPGLGFVSVSVIVTNTQIVWLTNQTSHAVVWMGNTIGVWTNYDNASLFVNSGDSVCVTNISGTGGGGLVGSWFQALH